MRSNTFITNCIHAYVRKYFTLSRISYFMLQRRVKIDLSHEKKKKNVHHRDEKVENRDEGLLKNLQY